MRPSLIVSSLLAWCVVACRTATAPAEPDPTPATEDGGDAGPDDAGPTDEPADPAEPGPPEAHPYDLVVSFISPGDGTDHEAFEHLKAIVAETPGLVHARGHWGREGEHDECFMLTGLTPTDRMAFVARVREEMAKSQKVNLGENAECQHQPR